MKHLYLLVLTVFNVCALVTLPPGQAKKVTGSQSAKAHAPGQLKKSGRENL
ncbi:MAG: hypothetical protein WBG48_11685 [Pricia sp.]